MPVPASTSCPVIRTRLPDLRTLPSNTRSTFKRMAISRISSCLPLKAKADVRLVTDVGEGGVDRRCGPRVGQRAVGGGEHELRRRARDLREVLGQHVGGLLRLGALDLEGVGQLAAAGLSGHERCDGDEHPGDDARDPLAEIGLKHEVSSLQRRCPLTITDAVLGLPVCSEIAHRPNRAGGAVNGGSDAKRGPRGPRRSSRAWSVFVTARATRI